MTKNKTAKKKVGRKPKVFTPAQWEQMGSYALAGCQNGTIAALMDIPKNTLIDHCRTFLHKKRCQRKLILRKAQNKHLEKNPIMCIFLGKNELGQSDKQETVHGISDDLADLMKEISGENKGLPIPGEGS